MFILDETESFNDVKK